MDAGKLGSAFPERNVSVRCVLLMLGNDMHACFDTDLLRIAMVWRGDLISLTTMAQVSYGDALNKNNALPRVLGTPMLATGIYPGWMGAAPDYRDPRAPGPYEPEMGRGPIEPSLGRWNGLHVVGKDAVLSYTVAETEIHEQVASISAKGEVGISRTFQTSAVARALTLVIGEVVTGSASEVTDKGDGAVVFQGAPRDTAIAVAVRGAPSGARLQVDSNRFITLRIPAGAPASRFRVVAWRGRAADRDVVAAMDQQPIEMARFEAGGPPHWAGTVASRGSVSPDSADYVIDHLALPMPNPWRRNVRVADIDFFSDGRAAVVTFDGDVWIVSGIDRGLRRLEWKRFASGLFEPLNVQVVHDTVYVFDREGIVRLRDLNGDGEADQYENFTNLTIQTSESREFPLGMSAKPGGGFYLSMGGALDNGPKTSPAIAPGFRAGSLHSGTVQEVSADGRSIRTFASGLREPNIGLDPRSGLLASSDQQGNFVPSTPVYLLERGGYYGVTPTAHRASPPAPRPPLLWIPHEVDPSGSGEVWTSGDKLGFEGDALVHLSYAKPGPFRVFIDSTRSGVQGAAVALPGYYRTPTLKGRQHPVDGQLYLAGFKIWGSNAKDVASLVRLRRTARPSTLPVAVHAGEQGILVRFATPLDARAAVERGRYQLQSWSYVRSSSYGSGHFKRDSSAGHDRHPVDAHLSPDGRTVLLVVPQMRPVMQMQLDYDLRSRQGTPIRSTLYLTVHSVDAMNLAAAGFGSLDWRASARRADASASVAAAPAASSAAIGARLFQRSGCAGCHSVDGTAAGKTGPTLKGVYGSQVKLANRPARLADEDYIRQSLLDPSRELVQGYEPFMPSFRGVLTDAEVSSLVMYVKTLGVRGTVRR
ncbi:MAG: cytochrome c class [Gemmatimonadetes bacterium]|nr:cytochrome c class [Gemmatimonadota bacterium]